MSENKKNFYIFVGIVFAVFIGVLFVPNQTQAVVTECSQLAPAACQSKETRHICYPQWCAGPEIDVNGGAKTQIWCRHRPCEWTGSECRETPAADEYDDLFEHCENKAINDCTLGWDPVDVSQGWCTLVDEKNACIGNKWCASYKEKQYRKYYCEGKSREEAINSGEGIGSCGSTVDPSRGVNGIEKEEETCACNIGKCGAECVTEANCRTLGYTGDVKCSKDCVCVGGAPPECPRCPPELGEGKRLVPCGRSCYIYSEDPAKRESPVVCQPCKLCHFFVMLDRIIDFVLFTLVPIIAVLMIVIGGIMFMIAHFGGAEMLPGGVRGGPAMLGQAKKLLTSVVIGLVLIYGAYLIIGLFLQIIGLADWTTDIYRSWWEKGFFEFPCP